MSNRRAIQYLFTKFAYLAIMATIIALSLSLTARGLSSAIISSSVYVLVLSIGTLLSNYNPYYLAWKTPRGDTITDCLHLLVSTSVASAIFHLLAIESRILEEHLAIPFWPNHWPWYIQLPLLAALAEFGGYWAHRVMHANTWLNRFHSVHHSAKRLYPLNATRNHPIDLLITLTCALTPLILLGVSNENLTLVSSFLVAHLVLQHSNTELSIGAFDRVLNMCQLHKWHHVPDVEKQKANYGNVLLIWDHVFGTYQNFDKKQEVVLGTRVAISPHYFPQLLEPFRKRK